MRLFLLSLAVILLYNSFSNSQIIEGIWDAAPSSSNCTEITQFIKSHTLRVRNYGTTNWLNTAGFEYYNPKNISEKYLWNCTIDNSTKPLSCGVFTVSLKCNFDKKDFPLNLPPVTIKYQTQQWLLPFAMILNFTKDNENQSCKIEYTHSIRSLPPGNWLVKSCVCPSCCYKNGTNLKISQGDDIRNLPNYFFNSSELSGGFCDGNMKDDVCYVNETTQFDSSILKSKIFCSSNSGCFTKRDGSIDYSRGYKQAYWNETNMKIIWNTEVNDEDFTPGSNPALCELTLEKFGLINSMIGLLIVLGLSLIF